MVVTCGRSESGVGVGFGVGEIVGVPVVAV